ncbi:hypothetical protein [Enemella evansiae]|nr:hypothetical protein [Enemella evansiae]
MGTIDQAIAQLQKAFPSLNMGEYVYQHRGRLGRGVDVVMGRK